jgi:hypothetical protein
MPWATLSNGAGVRGTAECGGSADTFRISSSPTAALHKGQLWPRGEGFRVEFEAQLPTQC